MSKLDQKFSELSKGGKAIVIVGALLGAFGLIGAASDSSNYTSTSSSTPPAQETKAAPSGKPAEKVDKPKPAQSQQTVRQITPKSAPEPAPAPKPRPSCDPNYSEACVPIASDVDCAGGSGNGPSYVSGPVRVIGSDIYDLDRNGDGVGCE